jgi:hypothetical protein
MKNKNFYIKSVLVVFGLLILSRIPSIISGQIDAVLLVSTLVELVFFVWGLVCLQAD